MSYNNEHMAKAAAPSNNCSNNINNITACYAQDAPHRNIYITSRIVGAFIDLALIVLGVVAFVNLPDHGKWLSCTLAPAINAFVVNSMDFGYLVGAKSRFSPIFRMCWDGGLVLGFGIAAGFMASYTDREAKLSAEGKAGSSVNGVGLGAVILVLMLLELFNHLVMVRSGLVEWRALRSSRGQSAIINAHGPVGCIYEITAAGCSYIPRQNMSLDIQNTNPAWWLVTPLVWSLVVVAAPALLILAAAIYRLFLHPLAHIPGPRLAALSNVWYGRQVCSGRMLQLGKALHRQYGPIVRVGPNEVWLDSEEGFKQVYISTALQKPKVDWRLQPHFPDTLDLLSERDMRRYRLQRRLIGQVYQPANLRKFEPVIDVVLDQVVAQIRTLGDAEVDLKEWMHIITVECLGAIVLSWSPGYLKAKSDFGSGSFSYLGWKRKTVLGQAVHRKVKPRLVNMSREKPRKDARKDLMADLVQLHKERPEFNSTYLHRMAITNFGAGHETTTSALTSVLAMLGTHRDIQAQVADELVKSRETERDVGPKDTSPRTPLTQAAIKEAQRLYPVIGMAIPRRVPDGGVRIGDDFIPAGTTVGCNPVSLHRNKEIFGPDADLYSPERWLSDDKRAKTMERNNLTWGGGARTCPGKNLAEIILYKTIARLVHDFEVVCKVPPDDEICYYFMAMLTGVKVRFSKRKKDVAS
ncbi:hypothetical protein PspLS_01192 [Pyricularia sp. CBS 133598]|nr:hypothetical protein PspLS_01192 [Pyricularia sp. CBS 133598]